MAKKKKESNVLERTYNVPLRRKWLNVPKYKRAKKAVSALRAFVVKHMKSDNVNLGKYVNEYIWKHGIKNPPHHVKIVARKDSEGAVNVELEGSPVEEKEESKKGKKSKEKKKETKKKEKGREEKGKKVKKETKEDKKSKKEEKSKEKESKKEKTEKKEEKTKKKEEKDIKKDKDKKQ